MKKIILDSGGVISLALNRILWVLERVQKKYPIEFAITREVHKELIDNPLKGKRFKLEAMQVAHLIKKNVISVIDEDAVREHAQYLLELSNSCFSAKGKNLRLVHLAEVTCISACLLHGADAVMIDERTTRYIIEKPQKLNNILRHRLHTPIEMHKSRIEELSRKTKGIKFIRSAEFVTVAYEKGLFDHLLLDIPKAKAELLDGLLWGLKLNGCAISEKDLQTIKRIEK